MKSLKLITLLIAFSLLSSIAYSQSTIELKKVNKALSTGLKCCELLEIEERARAVTDSIVRAQDSIKAHLYSSLNLMEDINTEMSKEIVILSGEKKKIREKYSREKKRKRRWRGLSIAQSVAIIVVTYLSIK